jgi:D-xylose transport system substrate-binding protein
MKKTGIMVFALGAALMSSLSFAAPRLKVGLSLATLAEERWAREKVLFENDAKEMGIDLIVQSADGSESAQSKQIENLTTQKIDVLIVAPQNRNSVIPAVKAAKADGIKVIAYDRFIPTREVDVYVSFDAIKIGEEQAKMLVKMVPKGNYLWLGGNPVDDNAHLFREGEMNILRPLIARGDIKLVGEQWCEGWSPQEALKHTENALTRTKNKIDAVVAPNDGTAGGAIQALAAQNLAGKVPVTGQDAELAAVQRVILGTQTMTIMKDVRELVKLALRTAQDLKAGQPLKVTREKDGIKSILLDTQVVTKDNYYDTIIKTGFHPEKDVYRRIPKELRKKS